VVYCCEQPGNLPKDEQDIAIDGVVAVTKVGRSKRSETTATIRALRLGLFAPRNALAARFQAKVRELESHYLASGGPASIDFLHQHLTVAGAATFLGTTEGQVYNLLGRRELPYVPWGKRGKRFRRVDLIAWQETLMHQPDSRAGGT